MEFSRQGFGVGTYSLLQRILPTQGFNLGLLHCRQILYYLSHQGSHKYICQSQSSTLSHPSAAPLAFHKFVFYICFSISSWKCAHLYHFSRFMMLFFLQTYFTLYDSLIVRQPKHVSANGNIFFPL